MGIDAAKVAVHHQMEFGKIIFNGRKPFSHRDIGSQFFLDFTDKGLFRSFSSFHFAAGELPFILKFAVSTLGRIDTVAADHDRSRYMNGFH